MNEFLGHVSYFNLGKKDSRLFIKNLTEFSHFHPKTVPLGTID